MSAHALIIGLEHYQPQTPPLGEIPYAETDATAFHQALIDLGLATPGKPLLLSTQATKSTFESRLRTTIAALAPTDTFILFFSGYGFSLDGENFLTCHDTQSDDLAATSIPLAAILAALKKSKCQHITLFLDTAHIGLPAEAAPFSHDELETALSDLKTHAAFLSSQPGEASHSSIPLGHGIWTHHLLRALRVEEPDHLDQGHLITSAGLQNYLAIAVPKTLRTTVASPAVKQTPASFGSISNTFIIADLQPLLDARLATSAVTLQAPPHALFVGLSYGAIKSLSGFNKKLHKIPTKADHRSATFVAEISQDELKAHTNQVHAALRKHFNYGIADVDASFDAGFSLLKSKDFEINMSVLHSPEDPKSYVIRTEINNFANPAIVGTDTFNNCLAPFVNLLQLRLPPQFDIRNFVQQLETNPQLHVEYDANVTDIRVTINQTGTTLHLSNGHVEITTLDDHRPLALLEALATSQNLLFTPGSKESLLLP